MKNYIIVAIIIILIIAGVVWFKMKSPAPVLDGEISVTTEPAPLDEVIPVDNAVSVGETDETSVSETPAVQ